MTTTWFPAVGSGLACGRVARVRTRLRCLGALWEPAFPGHESFEMITFKNPTAIWKQAGVAPRQGNCLTELVYHGSDAGN